MTNTAHHVKLTYIKAPHPRSSEPKNGRNTIVFTTHKNITMQTEQHFKQKSDCSAIYSHINIAPTGIKTSGTLIVLLLLDSVKYSQNDEQKKSNATYWKFRNALKPRSMQQNRENTFGQNFVPCILEYMFPFTLSKVQNVQGLSCTFSKGLHSLKETLFKFSKNSWSDFFVCITFYLYQRKWRFGILVIFCSKGGYEPRIDEWNRASLC